MQVGDKKKVTVRGERKVGTIVRIYAQRRNTNYPDGFMLVLVDNRVYGTDLSGKETPAMVAGTNRREYI